MTIDSLTSVNASNIPQKAGARGWFALAILMLPVLLVSVDNTVLSFALPEISQDLQPSATQQLWIIDSYALVLASLLVTMGSLGDRFGRRKMLLIGATGFALVSGLAAFAPSAEWLIAARAGMGIFGAMLMPATLSLLRTIFQDRKQRRLAVAIWAAGFSAGAALGPIVGGVLLEHFAWGSVFLMAVPVLIPLLVLAPILLPDSRDPNPGPIDLISIALSLAAMLPIVYAIKEIATGGSWIEAAVLFMLGVLFAWLFVRRQNRRTTPMLDMRLFKSGTFSGAVIVNLLVMTGFIGFLFFVSQHLQLVLGLSPFWSAMVLLPGLVVTIIAGIVIVPIASRFKPNLVVPIVLLFAVAGYFAVAVSDGSIISLMIAFASLGIGIGAAETISNELILSSAPPEKAGAASAVSETAYELGTVMGTALIGGSLTAIYRATLVTPAALSPQEAAAAHETLGGAIALADEFGGLLGEQLRDAATHAFDIGMLAAGFIGAGLIMLAMVVAATTLGRYQKTKKEQHVTADQVSDHSR